MTVIIAPPKNFLEIKASKSIAENERGPPIRPSSQKGVLTAVSIPRRAKTKSGKEAKEKQSNNMDVGRRRKSTGPRIGVGVVGGGGGVVVGSVWESRMKLDEFKGGIKVFNGESEECCISSNNDNDDNNSVGNYEESSAPTSNDLIGAIVPVVVHEMDKKVNPRAKQSPLPVSSTGGKRKTWKSESLEGSPFQIARQRSEMSKNLDEQCKELSVPVAADGNGIVNKRSPVSKKTRSESIKDKELGVSVVEGIEKKAPPIPSPNQIMKSRSSSLQKGSGDAVIEKSSVQLLRKVKSESVNSKAFSDDSCNGNAKDNNNNNSLQLVKAKSDKSSSNGIGDDNNSAESKKNIEESNDNYCKVFDNISEEEEKEKVITSNVVLLDDGDDFDDEFEEASDDKLEAEVEKKSILVKEISSSIAEQKNPKKVDEEDKKLLHSNGTPPIVVKKKQSAPSSPLTTRVHPSPTKTKSIPVSIGFQRVPRTHSKLQSNVVLLHDEDEFEEASEDKREDEIEKKSLVVKEISSSIAEQKNPKKIDEEDKKLLNSNENPSIVVKKKQSAQSSPLITRVHPPPTNTKSIPVSNGFQRIPRTHSKLQSFVDLVMWKDASKSAFVFGIGTFFIISSSYTKDLNISLISVLSYMGLAYLAAIFIFRSFISRGSTDSEDSGMSSSYVVGEEEAIWLMKLFLPYVNEFLLKLKALFSGDPATTMKLAVLLFVLARCGSSITIWKMAKLSFFAVFTVPKICSSYSTQLTAYCTFLIRRFRDAWESCSHKKAVAFAIFTLVWNLSSIIARIWAVFMLFVAFRYYQNSMIREGWMQEEATVEEEEEDISIQAHNRGPVYRPRRTRPIITLETPEQKKVF